MFLDIKKTLIRLEACLRPLNLAVIYQVEFKILPTAVKDTPLNANVF